MARGGRGKKGRRGWEEYPSEPAEDVGIRLSVRQSVEYADLRVYSSLLIQGEIRHSDGPVGFFGANPVAQPVGVSAATALEQLGLGSNLIDLNTFDGLLDTPNDKTGYAGYSPIVNAGETALDYEKFVPESGGAFTGSLGVGGDLDVTGRLAVLDSVRSDLVPEQTDTYDLGTFLRLWRKGWLSELDTVLFAQNTATLLGGRFVVSKDAGVLATDVAAVDTAVDFGKAMTVGDYVVLRSSLQVEYMQVGALVSGTIYNVTRDLDGTGANAWPAGAPFLVAGADGDGRIELSAYDTPRVQVLMQGANWNDHDEVVRFGDLRGNWGYTAETYGLGLGEYAANKANLTWDPVNGLRLRIYNQDMISLDNDGNARIGANTIIDVDGIAIEASPEGQYESGRGFRFVDDGGAVVSVFSGDEAGVVHFNGAAFGGNDGDSWWFGSGAPGGVSNWFGGDLGVAGSIKTDEGGLTVNDLPDGVYNTLISLKNGGTEIGRIGMGYDFDGAATNDLMLQSPTGAVVVWERLEFWRNRANGPGPVGDISIQDDSWLRINQNTAKNIYTPRYFRADGGLSAGYAGTPGGGNVAYSGKLRSYKNSTQYDVYGYHPLVNSVTLHDGVVLTGSNYTGQALYFSAIPAGAKAIVCRLSMQGTVVNNWVAFGPYNNSNSVRYHGAASAPAVDVMADNTITIAIYQDRYIYRTHYASSGSVTYWLNLVGYYI